MEERRGISDRSEQLEIPHRNLQGGPFYRGVISQNTKPGRGRFWEIHM